ncbi:uncharacterized [Tachysurus ichikawai]
MMANAESRSCSRCLAARCPNHTLSTTMPENRRRSAANVINQSHAEEGVRRGPRLGHINHRRQERQMPAVLAFD